MKKDHLFTRKCLVCMAMVTLMVGSGCGKSNKDTVAEDFENVTVEATNTDVTQEEKNYSVPEHVAYDVSGDGTNSSVHVDADVVADGFENAVVYETTILEVNDDYVKNLASRLFDDGQYTVELPYWFMTKTQLNEAMSERGVSSSSAEFDENNVQSANYVGYYAMNVDAVIDGSQNVAAVDGQIFYTYNDSYKEKQYDPANGIYREVGDTIHDTVQFARLSGTIDGVPCELMIRKSGESGENRIWIVADDKRSAGGNEYDMDSAVTNENLCNYDDALKMADDMVARITDAEYDLCKVTVRSVMSKKASNVFDGYRFYFTPVVNDHPIAYNSAYTIVAGSNEYVDQPMLMIEIDDKGFIEAKYLTDISIDGCMSDAPALLTFEQSEEEMKIQLQAYLQQESGLKFDIDKIQFSHVLLRQDNRYAIVPFWMYYMSNSGYQSVKETAIFGVNALDGSVVVFGNLIDDYYSILGDR